MLKKAIPMAREMHQEIIDLRRDFHRYPETGFEVERTAGVVAERLKKLNLIVNTQVGKTGVTGDLVVPGAMKYIALRADMDALPMQELNDLPYKSLVENKAHMCGHDAHTAMLLGAAQVLSGMKESLKTNVRFIFQPSEENWPGGAPGMIEDGALEGIDEIYALHVWPTLDVGSYGICKGAAMATGIAFEIVVTGRGGHAAAPHAAIDPILIASKIVTALQTIIPKDLDALNSAILTVTQIHGGTTHNVIPDSCTISGTVRAYEKSTLDLIRRRINEISEGIAQAFGAKGEITLWAGGYPTVFNDEFLAEKVKDIATTIAKDNHVDYPAKKVLFGEDFSYYTEKIKGCYIHLGCRNEAKGITRMLHDPRFNIDEECLVYGTAMHVALALASV